MSKPKIFAQCKAGCEWETVHRSDFDKIASHIELSPDDEGVFTLEVNKTYKVFWELGRPNEIMIKARHDSYADGYTTLGEEEWRAFSAEFEQSENPFYSPTCFAFFTPSTKVGYPYYFEVNFKLYSRFDTAPRIWGNTVTLSTGDLSEMTEIQVKGFTKVYLCNGGFEILGKSAYEVAVENGFVGTEEEWLASLKGEKGEPGEKGEQGEAGETYAEQAEYTFTQNSFINTSGVITSANNVAYSSPIAVNAGEAVVFNAYVMQTMAAISTCDENGGNIVPKVIGEDARKDYFYRVETDGYIVLSFYYKASENTAHTAIIYGKQSNIALHDDLEKIKAEDTIFTRCKEQIENIFAGCDYHRQKTKEKNFALMMVSDLHGDTQRLKNAIELLNGCAAIDAGIMLGDMEGTMPSNNITTYVAEMNKAEKPFLAVMGNHDISQNDTTGTILTTEATSRYMKQLTAADIYTDRGYGYKDFDTHKIRLIILNQYDYPTDKTDGKWVYWGKTMYLQAQIDWFVSALANTPNDYTVIVACHSVQNIENDDTIINRHADCTTRNLELGANTNLGYLSEDVIGEIVDAFKRKATLSKNYNYTVQGSVTGLSVNADFSARTQSLFAVHIGGHTHTQYIGNKIGFDNQLVYVNDISHGLRNGGYTEFSLFPRNQSGKSQDLITVLCVDAENQMINLVRVGANRTIYMENYDVLNVPFGS